MADARRAEGGPPAEPTRLHRVAGRYEVDLGAPLSSVGVATVYKGGDLWSGRDVALKTLRLEYRRDPESRARFRHEARLMAFVTHPNLAHVYDLHEEEDAPWIVMEYIPGRTLKEMLSECGPLPPVAVANLLDQIAAALGYLHSRHLVHLNVNLQNVLVTPDGVVKLIAFDLTQPAGVRQELISGAPVSTAAYLAPEQARGDAVDAATDIYALGCVIYELLTGQPPFHSTAPGAVKNDLIHAHLDQEPVPPSQAWPGLTLPTWIDDVLQWALAKHPPDRYHDVASFARVFRAGLETEAAESAGTTNALALIVDIEDFRQKHARAGENNLAKIADALDPMTSDRLFEWEPDRPFLTSPIEVALGAPTIEFSHRRHGPGYGWSLPEGQAVPGRVERLELFPEGRLAVVQRTNLQGSVQVQQYPVDRVVVQSSDQDASVTLLSAHDGSYGLVRVHRNGRFQEDSNAPAFSDRTATVRAANPTIWGGATPGRRTALQPSASAQVSVKEAAQILGIEPSSVIHAIRRGRLVGTKLGGQWFIDAGEVETYRRSLAHRRRKPGPRPHRS